MNKKGIGGFGNRQGDINRKGRPKGHTPLEELKQAIKNAEATGSGSLIKRYVDLASSDRTVLLDIMKKLFPNAQSLEISGGLTMQDFMSKLRGEKIEDDAPTAEETNEPTDNNESTDGSSSPDEETT